MQVFTSKFQKNWKERKRLSEGSSNINFTKSILKYLDPNIYVGIYIKVLEELERKKKAK